MELEATLSSRAVKPMCAKRAERDEHASRDGNNTCSSLLGKRVK